MKINLFNLIFLPIIFVSVAYGDNRIQSNDFIVIIVNKEACNLSRKVEQIFQSNAVRNRVAQQRQQMFKYYAQDCIKYAQDLGTTHLPTIYRFRKQADGWYIYKLDPLENKIDTNSILEFIKTTRSRPRILPQPGGT